MSPSSITIACKPEKSTKTARHNVIIHIKEAVENRSYIRVFLHIKQASDSTSHDIKKAARWHGLEENTLAMDLLHAGW
jgi:2,3-bisphosphoglycerate-independent phosphoglycerate mutase